MKVNSVSLSINRYNMVFAQTQNNKDGGTGPLTQKNSSENMSISQSIPDPDVGRVMIRVPSNSSYLNRISHSGHNVKQALSSANEAAAKKTEKLLRGGDGGNVNIYQQMHQMSMYKRAGGAAGVGVGTVGEQRDFESIQQIEEIGEDNLDENLPNH